MSPGLAFVNGDDKPVVKRAFLRIHYHTEKITITPAIKKEAQRVFDHCANSVCVPGSSIRIVWMQESKDELSKTASSLGEKGRGNVNVSLEDSLLLPLPGQTGNWDCNINPPIIADKARELRVPVDQALATVIAHEVGLHAVGRKSGHFHEKGFIDATIGKVGGDFSPEACKLICRTLGLELK